jgi:hypothetical protein
MRERRRKRQKEGRVETSIEMQIKGERREKRKV